MEFNAQQRIVLASASPRRKQLLESIGIPFSVVPAVNDEPPVERFGSPREYVEECARQKAQEVAERHSDAAVIGADTAVVVAGEVLLKPKRKEQAVRSLNKLSGTTHQVITAVSILHGEKDLSFTETTDVTFFDLKEEWIDAYTNTEDPYDKAGAYGIQTASMLFVKEIKGDYNTVVGLPIARLTHTLSDAGIISLKGEPGDAD